MPLSVERKRVLPWRQSLFALLPVVCFHRFSVFRKLCSLKLKIFLSCYLYISHFLSLFRQSFIVSRFTNLVLDLPTIAVKINMTIKQTSSSTIDNFSKSDLAWKLRIPRLSELRKWPPDIYNSLLSQHRKRPWKQSGLLYDSLILCFRLFITGERKHSPSDLSHSPILPFLLQTSAREEDVDDSLIAQWTAVQPLTIHRSLFCPL